MPPGGFLLKEAFFWKNHGPRVRWGCRNETEKAAFAINSRFESKKSDASVLVIRSHVWWSGSEALFPSFCPAITSRGLSDPQRWPCSLSSQPSGVMCPTALFSNTSCELHTKVINLETKGFSPFTAHSPHNYRQRACGSTGPEQWWQKRCNSKKDIFKVLHSWFLSSAKR